MVGHSMGALHSGAGLRRAPSWSAAVVIEDMAPDFRGRTTGPWEPWLHALPAEFATAQQVYDEFGLVAGQYFLEAFDRVATGWRLHGDPQRWIEIAAEWGTRDTGVSGMRCRRPTLLIEAGNSVTPPGQMATMAETGCRRRICTCPAPVIWSTTTRPGNTRTRSRRFYRRSPVALELGHRGCCSKRVRMASKSCCTR